MRAPQAPKLPALKAADRRAVQAAMEFALCVENQGLVARIAALRQQVATCQESLLKLKKKRTAKKSRRK